MRAISTSDSSFNTTWSYYDTKIRVKFTGGCLKQSNISYTYGKLVKIYIVYQLGASSSNNSYPTLKNCLFSAVTSTKNTDVDRYRCSGYGIEFDRRRTCSFPGGGFGQNVLILEVNMSSSSHIDNKKTDILVLGIALIQELEHTLTAEKMCLVHFTVAKKKFCLSLYYNGANSCLFVNGTGNYKFKTKDSEIVATPLCLANISKDWSADKMKKTGFNGYVYDFIVDCDATDVDDIKDFHKYLMKKNNIV